MPKTKQRPPRKGKSGVDSIGKNRFKKFFSSSKGSKIVALAAVVATLSIGYAVFQTGAASFYAAVVASSGSISGNAKVISDSGASNGTAVEFGVASSPSPTPDPDPAPTPDPDPDPTPPPSSTGRCPAFPAVPDTGCTGVPSGVTLTKHNGDLYVTSDGAVIDAKEVNGCIYVQADNVTIKRTKVNGWCWSGAISTGYGEYSGTLIEDVEVNGTAPSDPDISGVACVGVNNYTARRLYVHHCGRAFNMGSNVTIEDSYMIQMYGVGTGEDKSHNSGIGSNSGRNITIRHNNIWCDIGRAGNISNGGGGCSGALVLYADTFEGQIGTIDNLLIEKNMFNAGQGSYCLLIYNPSKNATYTVRDNFFGTVMYPTCGQYGPVDTLRTSGSSMTWTNNTWYAPGQSKHGQQVPLDSAGG